MRADRLLTAFLSKHLDAVHCGRRAAVLSAVTALVRGGSLMLSRLGRSMAARSKPKHGIKRVDRLYGNERVREDRRHFYQGIAHGVLKGHSRPIVVVDWTEAGRGTRVLAAAAPFSGRAVTLYAEAHPLRHYMNPRVEAEFLLHLRDILPANSKPIVVTDAGFRAPWIRRVLSLGWDYVGRVRGRSKVRRGEGKWHPFDELYPAARLRPVDLGCWWVARYHPFEARLVLVRRRWPRWKVQDRRRPSLGRVRGEVEGGREPWLLATSILDFDAAEIAALYAKRMQIEETFRDAKSHRFGVAAQAGWWIREQRGRCPCPTWRTA